MGSFAVREDYGRYLSGLLHETVVGSEERLKLRHGKVRALPWRPHGPELEQEGGSSIRADIVVLALGNLPPQDVPALAGVALPEGSYVPNPWAEDATAGLSTDDTVLILGTGLTMVDVAVALEDGGFGWADSRPVQARLAAAHACAGRSQRWLAKIDKPEDVGSALLARMRKRAREVGWRAAVDALRPHKQVMWMGCFEEERERFLPHLRPW